MRDQGNHKKHMGRWIVLGVLLLVIGIALILWRLFAAKAEPSSLEVLRIGSETICLDEVNLCILQNVTDLGIGEEELNTTEEDGSEADAYYKQEILQLITDYTVEAMVADKQGMELTEDERASVEKDAVEYMGEMNGSVMQELGITQSRVADIYAKRLLAHKLEETVTESVDVGDQRYCTLYMLLFPKVAVDSDGNYETEEDGQTPVMLSDEEIAAQKAKADEAYERLAEGADIEALAEEYGVANVSGKQSNMAESFGDPFTEYATSLSEGEYSPVLDIASCYAIVQMVDENQEDVAEQVLAQYRSELEQEELSKQRAQWYEEMGVEAAETVGNTWDNLSLYDFVEYVED